MADRKFTPRGAPLKFVHAAVARARHGETECIIWPYTKGMDGHGQIGKRGTTIYAHRLALSEFDGTPYDQPLMALHRPIVCHRPDCINPLHLIWGTAAENQAHRFLDGTANSGLTDDDVRDIRRDERPHRLIAAQYGVTIRSIGRIRRYESWTRVT